ncbi:ire1-related [Anaeramoeba ignava]|uniref:non-specific serine/threonine protein kinase n=1 Tax=Anaeramoeba ignava TaxID=1746090 RepID=A0A9Q0LEH3_ANAIG|nr:ire1-related [Anaeramoeba ignava]
MKFFCLITLFIIFLSQITINTNSYSNTPYLLWHGASNQINIKDTLNIIEFNGNIHSIDLKTGKQNWVIETNKLVFESKFEVTDPRTFFIPNLNGNIYSCKKEEEIKPRLVPMKIFMESPYVSSDGTIYLTSKKTNLLCINNKNGEIISSQALDDENTVSQCKNEIQQDIIVLVRSDNLIFAIDQETTQNLWNMSFSNFHMINPFFEEIKMDSKVNEIDSNYYIITLQNGTVLLFNTITSKIEWSMQLSSPPAYLFTSDLGKLNYEVGFFQDNSIGEDFSIVYNEENLLDSIEKDIVQWKDYGFFGPLLISQIFISKYQDQYYILDNPKTWTYLDYPIQHILFNELFDQKSQLLLSDSPHTQGQLIPLDISNFSQYSTLCNSNIWECLYGVHSARDRLDVQTIKDFILDNQIPPKNFLIKDQIHWIITIFVFVFVLLHIGNRFLRKIKKKKNQKIKEENLNNNNNNNIEISLNSNPNSNSNSNLNLNEIVIGDLNVSKNIIGYGSNGTVVYEGILNKRKVAVKRMIKEFCSSTFQKEVQTLLESDDHPNVVKYYSTKEFNDFVYIALQFCPFTFEDIIKDNKNHPFKCYGEKKEPTVQLYNILKQIANGVGFLHSINIIHYDIKPLNILLDKNGTVKISDMGLSKKIEEEKTTISESSSKIRGTHGWRSPEILLNQKHTSSVDVFSIGCVFFYALTQGVHPFGDSFEIESNITSFNPKNLHLIEKFPIEYDLVSWMLEKDPQKRPTINEVTKHPMFWKPEQKLNFLIDASDILEFENQSSLLVQKFEKHRSRIIGQNWMEFCDTALLDNLKNYRQYKGEFLRDLLRVIRNKKNHFKDLPIQLQQTLGPIPDNYLNYFFVRFPGLFVYVYHFIRLNCFHEQIFQSYW